MNAPEAKDADVRPWHRHPGWSWARRLLALGVLIVLIAVVFESIDGDTFGLEVCSSVPAQVGSEPTADACRPLSMTDPAVLLSVLLFVVLLLPDVTKIGIPGLLELERKVEGQERRTETLERMVLTQQTTVNIWPSPDGLPANTNLGGIEARIAAKETRF